VKLLNQIDKKLYPDLVEAGGLSIALSKALAASGSKLKVTTVENFIPYARVADKSRSSQMYIAAQERLFIFDFWSQGVLYANGVCRKLNDAVQAIHFWISEGPDLAKMEKKFKFFRPTDVGKAHEAGQAVEHQWQSLLQRWTERESGMFDPSVSPRPLIEAAMKRPELRQLFPYTSLYSLCFSRTTGYPFTYDCPHASPIGGGRFLAYSSTYTILEDDEGDREAIHGVIGEGTAEEVIDMLIADLPPGCGPAVSGTAKDLEKQ
jgi:hypothetical protein